MTEEASENTAVFKEVVAREKYRGVPETSRVTTDLITQVKAAVIRQY